MAIALLCISITVVLVTEVSPTATGTTVDTTDISQQTPTATGM